MATHSRAQYFTRSLYRIGILCCALPLLALASQDYTQSQQAQSVIERRCVICHGCYDAPCQLKLSSLEGLLRGASAVPVYKPSRLQDQTPTRLGIDAQTPQDWRPKGFHSLLTFDARRKSWWCDDCLLEKILRLKDDFTVGDRQRLPADFPLAINRELACPTATEFDHFRQQHPLAGMPYGMAPLPERERVVVRQWLNTASLTLPPPPEPPASLSPSITRWEEWLNAPGKRQRLVARYLYEHIFLAHLHFTDVAEQTFFRLVRSKTPSGEPIDEIASVHPTDDPGHRVFYYRLKPIQTTLVDKTHIVYALNDKKRERFDNLFFNTPWQIKQLPDYTEANANNPFDTFATIPARARYQFLLDDAFYFIQSFIKGPVCRGQVALNVINDHFYVNFVDPDRDLSVVSTRYLQEGKALLALPQKNAVPNDFVQNWFARLKTHRRYLQWRDNFYSQAPATKNGLSLNTVWPGEKAEDTPALTVFRHFDSATVVKGFVGDSPRSVWLIDYPILERIYYDLVANFNVFGNASHQILTRMQMDYLRMEAETLFISLLPRAYRQPTLAQWYQGVDARLKVFWVHAKGILPTPTRVPFNSDTPMDELVAKLRQRTNRGSRKIQPNEKTKVLLENFVADKLAADHPWVQTLPELVYLLITDAQNQITGVYTLIRNKAHRNVSFIFREASRRIPGQDTMTVVKGTLGSYPNFFFAIPEQELTAFLAALESFETNADIDKLIKRYGLRRTDGRIWSFLDKLHAYRRDMENKNGLLDMNRYENL